MSALVFYSQARKGLIMTTHYETSHEKSRRGSLFGGLLKSSGKKSQPSVSPYRELSVDQVMPNPNQPRQNISKNELLELSRSIQRDGILQPITVQPSHDGKYYVVAGERRLRAAKIAGLHRIPVIVKEVSEKDSFRLALIENIQRCQLNAIEEAEAYRRIMADWEMTQHECADVVNKDRSTIANALRLLTLPPSIMEDIKEQKLTAGHGKALLSLGSVVACLKLAEVVKNEGLSVRATEKLCREFLGKEESNKDKSSESEEKSTQPTGHSSKKACPPELIPYRKLIRASYGKKAQIFGTAECGKIELFYNSASELASHLVAMGAEKTKKRSKLWRE